MLRYTMWMMIGAVVAVMFGLEFGLYLVSDPQVWIAAAIGGSLGLVAYGGANQPSFVMQRRLA